MTWSVPINGHTYTDTMMAGFGYLTHWPAMLSDIAVVGSGAADSEAAAAASAASAATYAAALAGTSSTSTTVGTGSKSFTASTAKQWVAGQYLYITRTSAPTTYMAGQVTSYDSGTGALVMDVQASNGSGTYTDWTISIGGARGATGSINDVTDAAKTTTYSVVSGDKGSMLRLSGTWTLTFASAATLGAGWWARWVNEGSGIVTLSATIDGVANWQILPGEARFVWSDGSSLRSVVLRPFQFSGTTTMQMPPGYTQLGYDLMGGGGGGCCGAKAASGSASGGSGGGGGARALGVCPPPSAGTSITVTAAAGGPAAAGTAGGASSIAWGSVTYVYAGGGSSSQAAPNGASLASDWTAAATSVHGGVGGTAGESSEYGGAGGGLGDGGSGNSGGSSTSAGAAGGAGGGANSPTNSAGGAGGRRYYRAQGGGGAAGTSPGGAGGTAALSAGGGGGSQTSGTAGAGGAGATGCGGGGGGAMSGAGNSGAGGNGGDGYAYVWGIV